MVDNQNYSRGDFHTYVATRTFHISFDAGKDNKAIRKDEEISYDGTVVIFSDESKHTSQELRGAIRQGWLRREGHAAKPIDPNDHRVKIRNADMTNRNLLSPPERTIPQIEGDPTRVVGDSVPMEGVMRSLLSDIQSTFAKMSIPPPEEPARQSAYPIQRADEGINSGITIGTVRGFQLDQGPNESDNQVMVSRNLRSSVPDAPEIKDLARSSFRGYASKENESVGVIIGGNQIDLEQSVKAVVSSTEDVGTHSKKAFVGSSSIEPSDPPQRQIESPNERLRKMIRTPTTFKPTIIGESNEDPVRAIDEALSASIEYRKNQVTSTRHVDTHQDLAQHFQEEGKAPNVENDDKVRLQTIRFFVPDFTWDKNRSVSTRVHEALSEDIRSMKLRAILAFEEEETRTKIITEFRKIRDGSSQ